MCPRRKTREAGRWRVGGGRRALSLTAAGSPKRGGAARPLSRVGPRRSAAPSLPPLSPEGWPRRFRRKVSPRKWTRHFTAPATKRPTQATLSPLASGSGVQVGPGAGWWDRLPERCPRNISRCGPNPGPESAVFGPTCPESAHLFGGPLGALQQPPVANY